MSSKTSEKTDQSAGEGVWLGWNKQHDRHMCRDREPVRVTRRTASVRDLD